MRNTRCVLSCSVVVVILPLVLLFASCNSRKAPKFDTEYQAIVLTNGQVLIGRIEGLDSEFPILREPYSMQIVSAGDPQNPQKTNTILVSRAREAHSPSYTVLQARNIMVIEPVAKGSRMEQLIAQEKSAAAVQPSVPGR